MTPPRPHVPAAGHRMHSAAEEFQGMRPAPDGRAAVLATLTEKEWQDAVIGWARWSGWRVYHTADSRRSAGGFPDLVLVKPRHNVIFAELKTIKGRISEIQRIWLQELGECPGVSVYVWRPDQEAEVKAVLGMTR